MKRVYIIAHDVEYCSGGVCFVESFCSLKEALDYFEKLMKTPAFINNCKNPRIMQLTLDLETKTFNSKDF